jgi:RNA polymerase-binding protein DksA
MNKKDLEFFKAKLLDEKKGLEAELSEVAQKTPGQTWEATSGTLDVDSADENEVADKFEEYEGNKGIVEKLEKQLEEVDSALTKITAGTYGLCEACKEPIERERLEANPSAKVSIKHSH